MESAAIEIRPACASDAEALAGLHDTAWRCAYRGIIPALTLERMIARRGPGWWQHALAGAPGAVLKLTFADALAGYVSLGPARRVVAGCRGEIYEIYLAPPYQGVGLGARLFRAARARLAGAGRRGLVVWALADNEPACAFYRALGGAPAARGFERLGERSFDKIAFCWN